MEERQVYIPCSGLYGSAQCCATDVLGIANLDCGNPIDVPTDAAAFQASCASIGQRARCCVLPIVSLPMDDIRRKFADERNSSTRVFSATTLPVLRSKEGIQFHGRNFPGAFIGRSLL